MKKHQCPSCGEEEENEKYNKPCPWNPDVMCVQYPINEGVDDVYCLDGCENYKGPAD